MLSNKKKQYSFQIVSTDITRRFCTSISSDTSLVQIYIKVDACLCTFFFLTIQKKNLKMKN